MESQKNSGNGKKSCSEKSSAVDDVMLRDDQDGRNDRDHGEDVKENKLDHESKP